MLRRFTKGICLKMEEKTVESKEKPLEKMTVKEMRQIALQMPEITGVHGKNKAELLSAIKEAKGIVEEPIKKADATVREMKKKIRKLKYERTAALEAQDNRMAKIYKRRISRLKKKTRRAA